VKQRRRVFKNKKPLCFFGGGWKMARRSRQDCAPRVASLLSNDRVLYLVYCIVRATGTCALLTLPGTDSQMYPLVSTYMKCSRALTFENFLLYLLSLLPRQRGIELQRCGVRKSRRPRRLREPQPLRDLFCPTMVRPRPLLTRREAPRGGPTRAMALGGDA